MLSLALLSSVGFMKAMNPEDVKVVGSEKTENEHAGKKIQLFLAAAIKTVADATKDGCTVVSEKAVDGYNKIKTFFSAKQEIEPAGAPNVLLLEAGKEHDKTGSSELEKK